jgi:ABC-type multidrug transport system ATPase subunit
VSDTPETDAAFHKGMNCKEVFEFCRKLERERDRARALAEEFHRDQVRLLMENRRTKQSSHGHQDQSANH